MRRNPDVPVEPLRLDGDELNLSRVLVDGQGASFRMEGDQLVHGRPARRVRTRTVHHLPAPSKNTKLMGLFVSEEHLLHAVRGRGLSPHHLLSRPPGCDGDATQVTLIRASKADYPMLLSNGNLVEQGDLPEGRHFAKWVDPFKKPSYLFALVAGKLVAREQRIRARNGKEHLLQVFVRAGRPRQDRARHEFAHATRCVWDEARFGLPLDLERFMIVATSDFNMGAMENKGLNIFNTKYVLANQATATDADYSNIESVVGHEYFHNWSGDRVTCRDWFQLSLKEGLTVFRDQEFSQDLCADASARAVKRIEDVRVLRTAQFPEDAGPMAHPVRPDSYIEISNFYTVTIYEKGAEVVRMMQTLVGRKGFEAGITLYFERHDGQAVTCDDFAQAIADANPESELARLLPQFKRWYSQAGTPRLAAHGVYDAQNRSYTLSVVQSCPPTPGQPGKEPFVIPLNIGLLDAHGRELPLQLEGESDVTRGTRTLVLSRAGEQITFVGLDAEPVPSILRGFSAPVILDFEYTDAQLLTLLANDPDPFNRWEAGQRLGLRAALQAIAALATDTTPVLNDAYIDAMRSVLRNPQLDAAFKELVLTLPSETYIAEQLDVVDPQRVHLVRDTMRAQLATALFADWQQAYEENHDTGAYSPDPISSGRRALAGMALNFLCLAARASGDTVWPGKTLQRFKDAGNMTDRFNALNALVSSGHTLAAQALARFHAIFKDEALVIDKWFSLQAGASDRGGDILPLVKQLMKHPDFSLKNPNRARSVIFSYCSANPGAFHRPDAAGYVFWSDRVIELDAINPQVAARLARALDRWSKLAEPYRSAAREAIARVAAKPDLSKDTHEVVTRALAGN
jgi:aminopeptidase N